MFKQVIETLKAVRDAIAAKDSKSAEAALTVALVQIVDLFGDNENYMQKIYPMLESLRGEIQTEQFKYASETTEIILELFQESQQTIDQTTAAEPHETEWANEREALHARLRASGLKVTLAEPPVGEQPLVVTFHNPSAREKLDRSAAHPPKDTGEK